MNPLNFRQIHLDFHTSEKISDIGKQFDKKQFQDVLSTGHVNSITLFSKCHHGWAYHPSEANTIHPYLGFDLLDAQIEAAHEIDVKTPVYISAGLDEKLTREHPEWLFRNKDESTTWVSDFTQPGYHLFCFNSPYLGILLAQIEEVVKNYDADGIFLDIVKPKACYCQNCVKTLLEEGKNPYSEEDAIELGERIYANYTAKVRHSIDQYKPGLPVFHNGGHITKGRHDLAHMNTHLELESLPTGGWGYDHFPLSAKYIMNEGMDFLGMTGKFHTTWGEFGGFKHPNALIYETSLSIAMGGKCSIGDQLHPSGIMDPLTYKTIGAAYSLVEQKEAWCENVKNIADIAILSAESLNATAKADHNTTYPMDIGANRMLLQEHYLYEFIDPNMDFDAYKVLILPDTIRLNVSLRDKIIAYQSKGGKLLVTGKSGLSDNSDTFELDLGVKWEAENTNQPNYYFPENDCGFDTPTALVMYSDSEIVSTTNGQAFGSMQDSYFNRTTFNFCSHQHTPSTLKATSSGIVSTGNTVYIPWQIFSEYAEVCSLHLRTMVCHALDYLLNDDKTIICNLPSQGIISYMRQPKEDRSVLHLLYASPVLRGNSNVTGLPIEIIEDLIPINDTLVTLRSDQTVRRLYLAPEMSEVEFEQIGNLIRFKIDSFTCHQMIVVE